MPWHTMRGRSACLLPFLGFLERPRFAEPLAMTLGKSLRRDAAVPSRPERCCGTPYDAASATPNAGSECRRCSPEQTLPQNSITAFVSILLSLSGYR